MAQVLVVDNGRLSTQVGKDLALSPSGQDHAVLVLDVPETGELTLIVGCLLVALP